jgi:hypothetical protein
MPLPAGARIAQAVGMTSAAPTLAPPVHPVRRVRCLCAHCGAHVMGLLGYTLGGCCDNCGSYEISPLDE